MVDFVAKLDIKIVVDIMEKALYKGYNKILLLIGDLDYRPMLD